MVLPVTVDAQPAIIAPVHRRRRLPSLLSSRASGWILVGLLLLLWELSVRLGWVQSETWPAFSAVLVAGAHGLASGELPQLVLSSLGRMAKGYALGCAAGVSLALVLRSSRLLLRIFNPMIEALRPIPTPAIIPPLILFLGVADALKIFVVMLATFFPVFVNTLGGMNSINQVILDTARTFRIGRVRTALSIILPAALPAVLAGMRVSLSLALVVVVLAEMISGSDGIGYYLVMTQYALRPEEMYAGVFLLAFSGYVLNLAFQLVEHRLLFWHGAAQAASRET